MIDLNAIRDAIKRRADITAIAIECDYPHSRGNQHCCHRHGDGEDCHASASIKGEYIHCFVCNESLDVIALIMRHYGLRYIDALRYLAERLGIPWPRASREDRRAERQRMAEVEPQARKLVELKQEALINLTAKRDSLLRRRSIIQSWLLNRKQDDDPLVEAAMDQLDAIEAELFDLDGGPVCDPYDGTVSPYAGGEIQRLQKMPYGEIIQILTPQEAA